MNIWNAIDEGHPSNNMLALAEGLITPANVDTIHRHFQLE
jgi:hypothetical protein